MFVSQTDITRLSNEINESYGRLIKRLDKLEAELEALKPKAKAPAKKEAA